MTRNNKIESIIQYKRAIDSSIHAKHHELAKDYDISLQQYHLLIELDELMLEVEDGFLAPTVGELSKNIKKSQNTTSEKISRLEKKGLVSREKDPQDKRVSRIQLTDQGRQLIEAISKQANNTFLYDSIAQLDDTTIDQLLKSLKLLADTMK